MFLSNHESLAFILNTHFNKRCEEALLSQVTGVTNTIIDDPFNHHHTQAEEVMHLDNEQVPQLTSPLSTDTLVRPQT